MRHSFRLPTPFLRPLFLASLVVFCACGRGPGESPAGLRGGEASKLVMVGIDGADWRILRPLMEEGRLPNFARIVEGGASGTLESFEPTLSPALWTTVATGRMPGVHGIKDFVVPLPQGGFRPVTSNERTVPAFWNLIGKQGKGRKVGVVGWLASWPAEEVNGFEVTSYLPYLYSWSTGRPLKGTVVEGIPAQTYPPELAQEIAHLKLKPDALDPELVSRFHPPLSDGVLGEDASACVEGFLWSLAADETYRRIGLQLFDQHPVDLFAIYFGGVDVVSHRFWKFAYPQAMDYGVAPEEVALLSKVISAYYEYLDEILGEYISRMDEQTTLMVLSDHGFKPVLFPNRPTTSGHHRLEGVLILYGNQIGAGRTVEGATLLDILPTSLALLGEPISRELKGKVLGGAFDLMGSQRKRIAFVDAYPPRDPVTSTALESEVEENVLERLRSLGYIQ